MTQQDYEQKKRECLEEYVKTHGYVPQIPKDVFDYIFDRAYALGKQSETITQEEIEKAAEEFAERECEIGQVDWDALYKGYYHGMKDSLGKQEKEAEDDKALKVSRQLFCRLCADADDYIDEHLEEEDSDYSYYQGRSDALHELYAGEPKDAEAAVIQGWVARDEYAVCPCLYNSKPLRQKKGFEDGYWSYGLQVGISLGSNLFPDLTWKSEPIECEIIIKRKKK